MAKVEIYTIPTCPYCIKAKALLTSKGVDFDETDVSGGRDAMIERTGGPRTVPQIWINGEYIGGCDNLHALDAAGELDPKLSA